MARKSKLLLDTLFDTTNIEGEENVKVFEIAERIKKDLSQFPEFIGVFPFGSRTKGYADENIIESKTGMKGSDYDMVVLEDKNFINDGNRRAHHFFNVIGAEYRKKGIKIEFIVQIFEIKNLHELFEMVDKVSEKYCYVEYFANFCRDGYGEKINKWRNKIKEEIKKQPKETQEKLFQLFSNWLVFADKNSLSKITERIPDFNQGEYINTRRELWTKRVREIYEVKV